MFFYQHDVLTIYTNIYFIDVGIKLNKQTVINLSAV